MNAIDEMIGRANGFRLAAGSHASPDGAGNVCVNEAAIIAAGFEYRQVKTAADCPSCFSPVLSSYLIGINDMLPDDERQKLKRFVLRLSGSADSPAVEQARLELIVLRTTQRIVSSAMRAVALAKHAAACDTVETFDACGPVLDRAARDASAEKAASAARAAWAARDARAAWAASAEKAASAARDARAASAEKAASAARAARAAWAASAAIYADCIAIAEEAFAIGNQAAPSDIALVSERLDRARQGVCA